ncbi:MAG: methylglyoxal synthase [Gudongella sp.]|nr:methylglyoxal synthase [Gudongella sp.]
MNNQIIIMKEKKNIALIAHDNMKSELIEWVKNNIKILANHNLLGTGTTASLLNEKTGLEVYAYMSGPMGGDQQIGSRIAEGLIDTMIFFWDPLEAQPHDPDVKALLRIAVLYDIPVANNRATADFILSSPYISKKYERHVYDFERSLNERVDIYKG